MPNSDNNREDQNMNGEDSIGGLPPSITQRLRDILIDDDGEDLLMQSSDGSGDFRRWIEALDMQVIGACRNDERLKPLLKLNVSNGMVEDRLLAHLSQHFEPSEVGLLARCLCIPLVSVRVGKIKKQGTLLSPTSIRGNLCLTLLPTSDMRISFNGDDGCVERLATLSTETQLTAVEIEEILADNSGRSFLIKTADGVISYFWCCEKSKLLGEELLIKMKDFLSRKLSLAELTGISESRLNYFASELRAYLAGSATTSSHTSSLLSADPPSENSVNSIEHPSSTSHQVTSSFGHCDTTREPNQDSLVSRSNLLKEGISGNASSSSTYGESDNLSCMDTDSLASPDNSEPLNSYFIEKHKSLETNGTYPYVAASNIFCTFDKSPESPSNFQFLPSSLPQLSPHYCWCPPLTPSALQYGIGNSSSSESLPLPPLSSLLSSSKSTLNLADLPPLDFPTLLPEPFVRLPTSGHIPTFTPLMCDPIVHIPVIDICSSGPGYLVSAGPAMSTTIPPLSPDLMDPLLPKVDPTVESSARETLRMLLSGSSQPIPQVFRSSESMQSILVVGSRGLYSGTLDITGLSEKSSRSGIVNKRDGIQDVVDKEKPSGSGSSSDFDLEID